MTEFTPTSKVFENSALGDYHDIAKCNEFMSNEEINKLEAYDKLFSDGTYQWRWNKFTGLSRMNRDAKYKPLSSTVIKNESAKEWN